jgi:C4-dicarboxylate-specific signal transduction histidine kinase
MIPDAGRATRHATLVASSAAPGCKERGSPKPAPQQSRWGDHLRIPISFLYNPRAPGFWFAVLLAADDENKFETRPFGRVIGRSSHRTEFVTVSHAEDSKGIAAWALRADQLAHLAHRETSAALVAGLAHDLNQPLSAIGMLVCAGEDLLRKSSDPHAARVSELLAKIDAQTTRACEMSRRLSQTLRRSTPNRGACDPEVLIGPALERLAGEIHAFGADVRLRLDRSLRLGVVVDSAQMAEVVRNLVRNAIESFELSPADRRTVEICAKVTDSGDFLLEVHDTGPGVIPEMQSCLFEPFVTSKGDRIGLGLTVSRSIVEAHGGSLSLESSEAGARFVVALPGAGAGEWHDGD